MRKLFTFLAFQPASVLTAFFILLYCFIPAKIFAQGTGANTKCYADKDHDGFGDPNDYILTDPTLGNCSLTGRIDNGLDCDDNNAAINPNTVWYKDADNDGYTDGTTLTQCTKPTGYKLESELASINIHDCDDNDPNVNVVKLWYPDPDKDGYITVENNLQPIFACKPSGNYVSANQLLANGSRISTVNDLQLIDCNENDPLEHPNQQWYPDLDGDGYPGTITPTVSCSRPLGYKAASELISLDLDCNDNDPHEHPGQVWYQDFDNDGYGVLNSPLTQCTRPLFFKAASELKSAIYSDCNDNNATLNPETTWYKDFDGDGYDDGVVISSDCNPGPGYITSTKGPDCNDNDASINPETKWYLDADNDGYYTSLQIGPRVQCESPGPGWRKTGILGGDDCDDNDPAINPATQWYLDADNDGYYTNLQIGARVQCESPGPGWRNTGILGGDDCNDNNPAISPATVWYLDADNDGYYDPSYVALPSCLAPADGRHYISVTKGADCNDADVTYNPETVWVIDKDGDGYYSGDPIIGCLVFGGPAGVVRKTTQLPGDCDDNNASINPAAVWYKDADNDGYSDGTTLMQCARPTGYKLASELTATSGDCNDNDAAINPTTTWLFDGDNDGYYSGEYIGVGSCTAPGPGWKPASSFTKGIDCDDNDPLVTTGNVWYKDADNDGYSDGITKTQCDQPTGYKLAAHLTATSGDCNDNDATVNPATVWVLDADNDGYYVGSPVNQCSSPGTGYIIFTTQVSGDCNDNDANVHASSSISVQPGITTCSGNTATITASSSATNPSYSWYADAAGKDLLQQGTSASFTTLVLSGNTIFYVSVADGSPGCISVLAPAPVTVNPLPVVAAITYGGSTAVCSGARVTLSDATPGGTWSTSGSAATVSAGGVVNFATVAAGTSVTISYRVTSNGCSKTVGISFTVNPPISVKAITGTTSICGAGTTTLSDATSAGAWSSNNTAVATVSSTGVVTGKSVGSALITYTVSSGGCTASASTTVTVKASPTVAAISGTSVLVRGTSSTMTDATKGGTWSSSNTAIATVSTSGSVKGISAGTGAIYYTLTSGSCSVAASKPITVYNPLSASVTSGKIPCNGSSATLTIKVTGGSGGYQYSLNGGKFQTSNTYTVNAGTYLVVVKDNMAEQFKISGIIITQPAALALKLVKETNASSKTATNGSFTVSGSGGTPAYQYSKNGGSTYQSSGTFSSLAPGTYKVSIKDANNCVALNKLSVTVGYGTSLSFSTDAIPQISDEIVATVFPNPTETEFTLKLSGNNKKVELRVIDMYGRPVYHTAGSGNQSYKFGQQFISGVYIIEILQGKFVTNLKVIKGK